MNTNELISILCKQPNKRALRTPYYYSFYVIILMILYALFIQYIIGVRSDIMMQLMQPTFILECILLVLMGISSIISAILLMYPDVFQRKMVLKVPYIVFTLIVSLMLYQIAILDNSNNPMMVISNQSHYIQHTFECAVCIISIAIIPSGLMFLLQRKGATVYLMQSGIFAILAASSIGAFTLRLAEINVSASHIVVWHYLPTILFASIGAILGRWLLRW